MALATFETYVIHPGLGDLVPRIGSGMRLVLVKIGRKWVRIKAPGGQATRLSLKQWLLIPHVRYQGEGLTVVTVALNKWRRQ